MVVRSVDSEARQRFAQVVMELRGNRSYRSFAKILGVSHPTIKAWENLEVVPDVQSFERIAALRGETLSEFREFLAGTRQPTSLQRLIQQIQGIPMNDLAQVLRAIADRIENT